MTGRTISHYEILEKLGAADGSKVAYMVFENQKPVVYVVASRGGVAQRVCEDCGRLWELSPDRKTILFLRGSLRGVASLDVESGRTMDLLKHPTYGLYDARFRFDGRWIAFLAQSSPETRRVFIAPYRNETASPGKRWIPVTDGKGMDNLARLHGRRTVICFISCQSGTGPAVLGRSAWSRRQSVCWGPPSLSITPITQGDR